MTIVSSAAEAAQPPVRAIEERANTEVIWFNRAPDPDAAAVAWAADVLGELPLVENASPTDTRAGYWRRQEDGHLYRRCGTIVVSPGHPDHPRFRIHLYAGGTENDLLWLRERVEDARAGKFEGYGWHRFDRPWGAIWQYSMSRPMKRVLSDLRLEDDVVVWCDDLACRDEWHTAGGTVHRSREREYVDEAYVELARWDDEPWVVQANCEMDELTPDEAIAVAQALMWMAAEAKRLNAARAEVAGDVQVSSSGHLNAARAEVAP